MLSCTHMATVGVKGLKDIFAAVKAHKKEVQI